MSGISNDIDKIRLEIGATDPNATVTLLDDEITYLVTQESSFWGQAARCAEALSRKWAQKVDVRLGRSMQLTYSKMAAHYEELAKDLRKKALGAAGPPWVGGMAVADKETLAEDSSLVQPIFTRDMLENPRAGSLTPDSPTTSEDL